MTDKGSVFSKGGGGNTFEHHIQCAFVTSLIVRGNAPGLPANEIKEVAFQTTNRGYETDDLLVIAQSSYGLHKVLSQVKHNISFTADNALFKEVMTAFWKDYNNPQLFNRQKDKLFIVKSGLTLEERNHVKVLLSWAKTHATETDFFSEVNRIKAKKGKLEAFQSVLTEINKNNPLTEKEIWEFLKCLDILEYDFLHKSSVDEAYFLNLIKLSKNPSASASEKEIWDSILAFVTKLNKDGGSITSDSIKSEEVYKYFDQNKLSPYYKSLEKIRNDSELILKPIKSSISGYHIKRPEQTSAIIESINTLSITIVTGKPGVGKSAAVKNAINDLSTASAFVFRADQFNQPHLATVFSQLGINEPIQEIFSCLSLMPEKLLVIDSLEKLLEGEPENAFKQLLALLRQYPDIKLVATSRKYAIDLLLQKFDISKEGLQIVEVLPINHEELSEIENHFPQLKGLLSNSKIRMLLESPKYLEFILTSLGKEAADYSGLTLKELKNQLWNTIIEDITKKKGGLAAKRRRAFQNISIKRAKKMSLFVEPDEDVDEEAIEALERDEVIFKDKNEYLFSPTHDILEDWALVKYVASNYDQHLIPHELFTSLGNEPAIRRAFRLWVEDFLVDDPVKINQLINTAIKDLSIDPYWADELLIAVFRSEDCHVFFESFEKDLLSNNGAFLHRCLHIIKTCCRETKTTASGSRLIPIGSGWREALLFCRNNLAQIDSLKLSVLNLLFEWEYRLMFDKESLRANEATTVKEIVLTYTNEVENGDEFWDLEAHRSEVSSLISLLFNLAQEAMSEIEVLLRRAMSQKKNRDNWRIAQFYEQLIKKSLSGLGTQQLIKTLPKLIIEVAWNEWKEVPREDDSNSPFKSMRHIDKEDAWGINRHLDTFPSGVYKTPVMNLLTYHPFLGVNFVVELVNHMVESFVRSKYQYKKDVIQVEVRMNDGTLVKQWGNFELWAAYRGLSVTNYLLESVLMSLEKYLLDLASFQTQSARQSLKVLMNYLLKNSNSVTITSVLTSVAVAYPDEVEEEILPLFSVREFYEWDINRRLQEASALAPYDNRIPFAQSERFGSNKLSHRTKYWRGLMDFVLQYQFKIGRLNTKIHEAFDFLKEKADPKDIVWRKLLTEMDIRTHQVGAYDEKLGGFLVQPEFDKEVDQFLNDNKSDVEAQNQALNIAGRINKAHADNQHAVFPLTDWIECYNFYSDGENIDFLYAKPVSLAVIGLRDFSDKLNKEQRDWCLSSIINAIQNILQDTFQSNYELSMKYNLMEKEIALQSYHLLFDNIEPEEKDSLTALLIVTLYAPFAQHEASKVVDYMRDVLMKKYPEVGKKVWLALINYSKFRKSNRRYGYVDEDTLVKQEQEEAELVQNYAADKNLTADLGEINLQEFEPHILVRAFTIIPFSTNDTDYIDFIKQFLPLLTEDLKREETYSYNRRERQVHFESVFSIEDYIIKLFFNATVDLSKSVLDLITDPIYAFEGTLKYPVARDLLEFTNKILKFTVYKLDEFIANSQDDLAKTNAIQNFWQVWEYLFSKIKNSGKLYFTSTLLLDIEWKDEAIHWRPLDGKRSVYYKMTNDLGAWNVKSIVNVLSTIGESTLLPDGISWLVELLRNNPNQNLYLRSNAGERLIKRAFYNHLVVIKNSKQLINDFVYLLDLMVNLGSSQAYLIRENVITYKKVE